MRLGYWKNDHNRISKTKVFWVVKWFIVDDIRAQQKR